LGSLPGEFQIDYHRAQLAELFIQAVQMLSVSGFSGFWILTRVAQEL